MVKFNELPLKSDGAYSPVDKRSLKTATRLNLCARANGTYPGPVRKPKALKTLASHGIFNGRAVTNWVMSCHDTGRLDIVQYYKNRGCCWEILDSSAQYLLHTTTHERQHLWICLAEGHTTSQLKMELIETYTDYRKMLAQENDDVVRHNGVLVVDIHGVLH